MRRFFFNQYFTPRQTGAQSDEFVIVREKDKQFRLRIQCARFNGNGRIARQGIRYARERLKALSKCHEFFRDFSVKVNNETYASGTISAERPDNDMKDLILANAFKEKETLPHKVVDNE
jgi:hypothetical protein